MRFLFIKFFILSILLISSYTKTLRATTTNYCHNTKGACGCGEGMNHWQRNTFTAAGSSEIFGKGSWCGSGCGKCYD